MLQRAMADGYNKQAANARASERQLLTDLVMSRVDIIENEKTDSVTTRDKEAAWMAVAAEFNPASIVKRDTFCSCRFLHLGRLVTELEHKCHQQHL